MKRFLLGSALFVGMAVVGSSCSDDTAGEELCDPGSNVFCRCRGTREAGTKQCNETGDGFGACETAFGECEEIEDPSSSSSGTGNNTGTGGKPEPPDPGELFAACNEEEGMVCNTDLACSPSGYCTKACESYEDCTASGDCITLEGENRCAPYCTVQADCDIYSASATCGFTPLAVPTYDVVVCANWGDALALPPDGYPPASQCDDDDICNLGFEGVERVCDTDGCTDGCHAATDCSGAEATCSSTGTEVGSCGGTPGEDKDKCPGATVNLSASALTVMLSGDTSQAPPPTEAEGTGGCTSITPTEEDVYRVLVADAGQLIVNVESNTGYDPIVYVRATSCDTGTQFECADASAAGQGEILEFEVFDDDEFWVFVDGFNGSTGGYTIEFDLTVP